MVLASSRMGLVEPQRSTVAGASSRVPATVFRQSLPACRAAGNLADAQLSLRAARCHGSPPVRDAADSDAGQHCPTFGSARVGAAGGCSANAHPTCAAAVRSLFRAVRGACATAAAERRTRRAAAVQRTTWQRRQRRAAWQSRKRRAARQWSEQCAAWQCSAWQRAARPWRTAGTGEKERLSARCAQ